MHDGTVSRHYIRIKALDGTIPFFFIQQTPPKDIMKPFMSCLLLLRRTLDFEENLQDVN